MEKDSLSKDTLTTLSELVIVLGLRAEINTEDGYVAVHMGEDEVGKLDDAASVGAFLVWYLKARTVGSWQVVTPWADRIVLDKLGMFFRLLGYNTRVMKAGDTGFFDLHVFVESFQAAVITSEHDLGIFMLHIFENESGVELR